MRIAPPPLTTPQWAESSPAGAAMTSAARQGAHLGNSARPTNAAPAPHRRRRRSKQQPTRPPPPAGTRQQRGQACRVTSQHDGKPARDQRSDAGLGAISPQSAAIAAVSPRRPAPAGDADAASGQNMTGTRKAGGVYFHAAEHGRERFGPARWPPPRTARSAVGSDVCEAPHE